MLELRRGTAARVGALDVSRLVQKHRCGCVQAAALHRACKNARRLLQNTPSALGELASVLRR